MRTYQSEGFGTGYIPPELLPMIGSALGDECWHNDAAARFAIIGTPFALWCDHENPDQREVPHELTRFAIVLEGKEDSTVFECEDVADIVKELGAIALYKEPIRSMEEAQAFFRGLHERGDLFHPDDRAEDIIKNTDGSRAFSDAVSILLNKRIEEALAVRGWSQWGGHEYCACGWILRVLDPWGVKAER